MRPLARPYASARRSMWWSAPASEKRAERGRSPCQWGIGSVQVASGGFLTRAAGGHGSRGQGGDGGGAYYRSSPRGPVRAKKDERIRLLWKGSVNETSERALAKWRVILHRQHGPPRRRGCVASRSRYSQAKVLLCLPACPKGQVSKEYIRENTATASRVGGQ